VGGDEGLTQGVEVVLERMMRIPDSRLTLGRRATFIYCIVVLAVLISLALLYVRGSLSVIPTSVPAAALAAAWAGALGGIAISFKGVFDHRIRDCEGDKPKNTKWCNDMLLWHFGRPFTGVIVGAFVFIGLKAVYPTGEPNGFTLAAAAFVLGTQEKGFFDFVRKIGHVVVSIPDDKPRDGRDNLNRNPSANETTAGDDESGDG
jgi:hypothetical protein